ncbi:hypothetical protein [Leucobacter musarum]|uniref:hypothetical protein n=1 Tax=Leucobacter musarum TaxID=1930747 RepID=UPI0012E21466|nr:hypothetical protein [Leucobacter musarum]
MIGELERSFAHLSDRLARPFDRPRVSRVRQLCGGETDRVAQNVCDCHGVSLSEHASEFVHRQAEPCAAHIVA